MSIIKSPSFDCATHRMPQSEISPLFTSQPGSLISRISRGIASRAKKKVTNTDIISPTSTNFDSISTIKADDFLFDKEEEKLNIWYAGISQSQQENPVSPLPFRSYSGQTPLLCAHEIQHIEVPSVSFRNNASKIGDRQTIDHVVVDNVPSPRLHRLQRIMRVQGVGATNEVQRGISVSWDISPSKETSTELSKTEHTKEAEIAISTSHSPDMSNRTKPSHKGIESVLPDSHRAVEDQWREAIDPESGRAYYYNRRTRVSKWRPPTGAVVKSSRRHNLSRKQTNCSQTSNDSFPILSPKVSRQSQSCNERMKKALQVSLGSEECQTSGTSSSQHQERCDGTLSQEAQASPLTNEKEADCTAKSPANMIDSAKPSSNAHSYKSSYSGIPQPVFCLYCGCNCEFVSVLASHLTMCAKYARMQEYGRSTQIELEIILFRAWSQFGGSSSADIGDDVSYNKHLIITPSEKSSSFCFEKRSAILRSSHSHHRRETNYTKKMFPGVLVDQKKCPFCNAFFNSGNGYSSHMLVCTARRKVRQQRRTKKKGSPIIMPSSTTSDPRGKKNVTPGRRMPWE